MKNKININRWLELKPYDTPTPTDHFYLRLCDKIKRVLVKPEFKDLKTYLNGKGIELMSCFLVSYLEDIVSGTNIWNSFVNKHYNLYNKKLPFFYTNVYRENKINEQDISFLTWYFLNTIQEEKFIIPYNNFITAITSKVVLIFNGFINDAPVNKYLKTFYELDQDESDYYAVRNFIDRILFNTYLLYPDTALKIKYLEEKIIENKSENAMHYLQQNRDAFLHNNCTRLLSMKGKEWAVEILGKNHLLYNDILNISQRVEGMFFYKGQDEIYINLEHIASGKKFKLLKSSYDHVSYFDKTDIILFIGIVQWQGEWWFSGISFQMDFDANLILDQKKSIEARNQVNFLDHTKKNIKEVLQGQEKAFLSFNNGSPIAFLPSEKLNDFFKDFIDYYNKSLGLSEKEIREAKKTSKRDGFFGKEENNEIDFSESSGTGLVFFNPNSGVEIALNINSAFPMNINPYFYEEESMEDVMNLLLSEDLSKELAMFAVYNCKNDLTFFNKGIGEKYLDDIDFLLRFWKKESYHTTPSVTLIGEEKK